VYSRATTSAMALRPVFFDPGGLAFEDSLGAIPRLVMVRKTGQYNVETQGARTSTYDSEGEWVIFGGLMMRSG